MARSRYPPIDDYGLISDCHSMALVSKAASVDWCCMPRVDSASIFGRLLDWEQGGYCSVQPAGPHSTSRRYLGDTMVLETTFVADEGAVRVIDCFTMRKGGAEQPHNQFLRVIEGTRGEVDLAIELCLRFDYGEVKPWLRRQGANLYAAVGGNDGMLISTDFPLDTIDHHDLAGRVTIGAGKRLRLSLKYVRPEHIDGIQVGESGEELDSRLEETLGWWQHWSRAATLEGRDGPAAKRSALVLKGLTNAPTGAMAAAATTSLPEAVGGDRNWDYRFSWIRDSSFSVRALADMGLVNEADGFRRFIQRSSAGSADELQIMYGVGGERRLTEIELDHLDGYRGSRPVRIGNAASTQIQLDAYGWLLELSYRWHRRGHPPDEDYWRFLRDLVNAAVEKWEQPDRGIWEIRGEPQHFVQSKVMCWVAVDRGIKLFADYKGHQPEPHWEAAAAKIRQAVETEGVDPDRGVFVQSFGSKNLDASLLLLPVFGFVDYSDPRMMRTADCIRSELEEDGLVLRYRTERTDDGLRGREGNFLACTFWLAEVLARQGRIDEARQVFQRAAATANDLGLFSEEYDLGEQEMLGNFPQALTHLSHLAAAIALQEASGTTPGAGADIHNLRGTATPPAVE